MKTVMSSGHGLYVAGAGYFIQEVEEARKVVNKTKEIADLIKAGEVQVYHENSSKDKTTNVKNIVANHNNKTRELDVSVHFNSATFTNSKYTNNEVGIEVLYATDKGKPHAVALAEKLSKATGLKNRGTKLRTGLYFLNNTNKPAVLIEVCFVNSKKDVEKYQAKFQDLCIALAEYLTGGTYNPPKTEYIVRVTADVLNIREGAGTNYKVVGTLKKGDAYTIIETVGDWGRLKSGQGWICLSYTEKI